MIAECLHRPCQQSTQYTVYTVRLEKKLSKIHLTLPNQSEILSPLKLLPCHPETYLAQHDPSAYDTENPRTQDPPASG